MLYFIPAWYKQNEWCENEQNWYVRREHTEFDDTVKQVQLFHRKGVCPYKIMLLSFAPNFRHFIHRQGVYHAPYWSCFDAIQEIERKKVMVLSFHDIAWPEDIEFVYTPFLMIAMLDNKKYAQIEFGEDGNPIQIDMFQNEKICRRNIYDDRGFVSSTIVYDANEEMFYQDYLMESGIVKMRHFMEDGRVEINANHPTYLIEYNGNEYKKTFLKRIYHSIDEVIYEVQDAYIQYTSEQDIFCVAMHDRHQYLIKKLLKNKKTILTFFENRYQISPESETLNDIENADYIITDSEENTDFILNISRKVFDHITDITPYDSRVDFGISQQLNVQKILVPIDYIDEEMFQKLIVKLGIYLHANNDAQIHLFTRNADYFLPSNLLEKTRKILREADLEERWAFEEDENISENALENDDDQEPVPIRFYVEQCVDELSVSKCMREQRLIVDMRTVKDLYLRITAISMGIPQIIHEETKFVEHMKNGYLLKDMEQISDILDYYLDGLNNWNKAMIYSYELGKKYSTDVLVDKWKEVIDFIG